MKNKDVAIHFTKIARDKFQIYNFQTKDNQIANTRDLAAYLTNLRGGIALDNSFYSKLISMPNFSTIAITEDALKIKKAAANGKIEPWKLEKTADGEVFVSALEEDEEDDTILKKSASCHLKHHYVISIKAKNENQKITAYASLKKSACIPETNIEINPINDYVNFDYYSEKNPYDVIQAIVDLLVATGVAVEPSQIECCHDFCDCGMAQVGPIVPCEEDEYILDCYGEKPIVGQSVDSLQSYASAHNKKHFKIYAFDKVVFDSDAIKRKAADETTQKTKYILAGYTDGKAEFVEKEEYATLDGAKNAFDSFKAKAHKEDEFGNDLIASEFYIYETKDNGTTHDKTWKITSPVDLLPMQEDKPDFSEETKEVELPTLSEESKKDETELEIKEPQPLPTGEKKEEIEKKVETPEGQKLEEKVEETVEPKQASLKVSAAEESIEGWLKVEVDALNEKEEQEKGKDAADLLTMNTYENKVVVGGDTQKLLELEPKVKDKLNHYNMKYLVSVTPVEDIEGQSNLTIFTDMKGSWTDKFAGKKEELNKKSELNADPKVVVNKLETGDLLPGTEERKDGIKKLVNDKSKKEIVEDLKDKGHITEKEIEDVKKEDIEKKSNTNISGKTLDELITNLEKEGYTIKDFQPGLPKASVSAEKDGKKFNIEVSTMLNDDGNNDHRVTNIKEHTEITTDDNIEKESKVVKKDDKYQVQSEKGKNLGTYDTKEEAKDRLKEVEMFKHMDKKAEDDTSKEDKLKSMLIDRGYDFDSPEGKLIWETNKKFIDNVENTESALFDLAKVFLIVRFTYDDAKDPNFPENYVKQLTTKSATSKKDDITKKSEKVLIDKNTNQPIKPGDTTEGKELKEVEVDKSEATTTTASNAVYNLFMKSATIEVNKEELSLLTAAYHSPIFKKVAYLGPTAFAFRDQHAIFTVDGNKAVCRKEADLTMVEIKKQEQVNPGSLDSLSDSQLRDYIASLNKKIEVK